MKDLTPATEAELARMITEAEGPLRIQGGGTRPIGAPGNGTVLSTRGLTGIELYEPGALTMVVRAGTPLAEVEDVLEAEGQRLAFEPMDHRPLLGTQGAPTIGGVVAANVSGPRRIQAGACRDHLLGVRFVDGQGRVIKNGGRVMKNVTGYDLVKLMAGSRGTLGVLSDVSLKVLPVSQMMATLRLHGLEDGRAVKALSAALGSPYEVSGAAHLSGTSGRGAVTLIRLEGFEDSVAYRAGRLRDRLASFGEVELASDASACRSEWRAVRDVEMFAQRAGQVWRVSVKPSEAPAIVAQLPGAEALYDWGGGLIWLLLPEGCGLSGADIRGALRGFDGHARLIRGGGGIDAGAPLSPVIAALQAGLRQRFDPRGLFNPGLMGVT